jgi:tetratricopeptide (TPR) repeat protein
LTLRGEIAYARGNTTGAIADFRAVLRDEPQRLPVQRLLARAYTANGQAALAVESYRNALALAPHDASLQIELAQLLLQMHEPKQAVTLLERAVQEAPGDFALREQLARSYLASGDYAAARTSAEDLKRLRPESAVGYYVGGLAAQGDKRLEDAQREFMHALALHPGAFDVLQSLARLEVSRGQVDAAVNLVRSFADRNPGDANAQNLLAELYLAQKHPELAVAALNRAIELAPQWPEPYRNLAVVKFLGGDRNGAIAAYQAGMKAVPTAPKLVIELAVLYEKQGRVDEAIAAYEAWHRQNPKVQLVANNLAMLLVTYKTDRGSLDRARDLTTEFGGSEDGSLLDTDGWVHFKRAEYAQALPILERAAERAPDSHEIHYHLGMAELQAGNTERARHELETALSGTTTFTGSDEARSTLASLKHAAG